MFSVFKIHVASALRDQTKCLSRKHPRDHGQNIGSGTLQQHLCSRARNQITLQTVAQGALCQQCLHVALERGRRRRIRARAELNGSKGVGNDVEEGAPRVGAK